MTFTDLSSLAQPVATPPIPIVLGRPTLPPILPPSPSPILPSGPSPSPSPSPGPVPATLVVPIAVTPTQIGDVVPPLPIKPGVKTSEMYGNLLAGLLSVVIGSGLITSNLWLQITMIAGLVLSALGYTNARTALKRAAAGAGALLFFVTVASTATACTNGARTDTIHAALFTADAANATFIAYDQTRQAQIVAQATSRVQGEAALTAYETTSVVSQARLERALVVLYRAIAVARDLNDQPSLDTLAAALAQVAIVLGQLTGGAP